MTSSPTRHLLAFICSYSRLTPAKPKMWEKKELETVFRLFWNNINQLMMDYQTILALRFVLCGYPHKTQRCLELKIILSIENDEEPWFLWRLWSFTCLLEGKLHYRIRLGKTLTLAMERENMYLLDLKTLIFHQILDLPFWVNPVLIGDSMWKR